MLLQGEDMSAGHHSTGSVAVEQTSSEWFMDFEDEQGPASEGQSYHGMSDDWPYPPCMSDGQSHPGMAGIFMEGDLNEL